jgi:hypothetical protein
MKNILFSVILLFSFSLFAQDNQEISYLKVKQNSCIKRKGPSIILNSANADSRCPEGVMCIWAGEIKVVVSVYQDKKFITEKILTISGKNNAENIAWFSQYLPVDKRNVKSISVVPYPKKGLKIKPKDYYIRVGYIK